MTHEEKQKQLEELHKQVLNDNANVVYQIIKLEKEIYRAQVLEEVIPVLYTHGENDESRSECDAEGLYCRSGCVLDAVRRIQALKEHPTN